jgi:dephospho-CoA kinase
MLVGFAGFGGAGKTTAIECLERLGVGRRVYLGEAVLDEISRLGLARTPEAEKDVRIELRKRLGPGAFADLRASHVAELISRGECVLIDAIFKLEEYSALGSCGQRRSVLVAIETSFETRAQRLTARSNREYSADQLRIRDKIEIEEIGTALVLEAAEFRISNERSLSDFYDDVTALWERIAGKSIAN